MEVLQPRLFQLEQLWHDLGYYNDPAETWTATRLEPVLTSIQTLIHQEQWNRALLVANIHDLQLRIAFIAERLGYSPAILLNDPIFTEPTLPAHQSLALLENKHDSIIADIHNRKEFVFNILGEAKELCGEMELANPFPRDEVYRGAFEFLVKGKRVDFRHDEVDLSWAGLYPLKEKLGGLRQVRQERVGQFNALITRCRRLMLQLGHCMPADELDQAMLLLFEHAIELNAGSNNGWGPDEESEEELAKRELQEEKGWSWFDHIDKENEMEMKCLKLTNACLRKLKQRVKALSNVKTRRQKRWNELKWNIERIYDRLDWPEEERAKFAPRTAVTFGGIGELEAEFTRMKAIGTARRWAEYLERAETEDFMREVSWMSRLLGYNEDVWLNSVCIEQHGELQSAVVDIAKVWEQLQQEIRTRKTLVVAVLTRLRHLTEEMLWEVNSVPTVLSFKRDLSWANIRPLFEREDHLLLIRSTRIEIYEDLCAKIHSVYLELLHPINEPILSALARVFAAHNRSQAAWRQAKGLPAMEDVINPVQYIVSYHEDDSSDEGYVDAPSCLTPIQDAQSAITEEIDEQGNPVPSVATFADVENDSMYVPFRHMPEDDEVPEPGYFSSPLEQPLNLSFETLDKLRDLWSSLLIEKEERREWRSLLIRRLVRCYKRLEISESDWIFEENGPEDVTTKTLDVMNKERKRLEHEIESQNRAAKLKAAELEDLTQECERMSLLLGGQADLYISTGRIPLQQEPDATYSEIKQLHDDLNAEVKRRWDTMVEASEIVRKLSSELYKSHLVPDKNIFKNNLSLSRILPLTYAASELSRLKIARTESFEEYVSNMREHRRILCYVDQDELDEAITELYDIVPYPENPEETITYYVPEKLPEKLNLSGKCLAKLASKSAWLQDEYSRRLHIKERLVGGSNRIYKELNIEEKDRMPVPDNLSDECMQRLTVEYKRLKALLHDFLVEVIEKYRPELEELWEKGKIGPKGREKIMHKISMAETAEEIEDILVKELNQLRFRLDKGLQIFQMIEERKKLVQEMLDFEKRASDPKRLFGNSKLLLQEEKWRKTAYPSLVKLENNMIKKILEYEEEKQAYFLIEDIRYLDILFEDMNHRKMNATVFGFKNEVTERRRPKIDTGLHSRSGSRGSSSLSHISSISRASSQLSNATSKSNVKEEQKKAAVRDLLSPAPPREHHRTQSRTGAVTPKSNRTTPPSRESRRPETPDKSKPKAKVIIAFGSTYHVDDNAPAPRGKSQGDSSKSPARSERSERASSKGSRTEQNVRGSRPIDIAKPRKTTQSLAIKKLTPPDVSSSPDSPLLRASVGRIFNKTEKNSPLLNAVPDKNSETLEKKEKKEPVRQKSVTRLQDKPKWKR